MNERQIEVIKTLLYSVSPLSIQKIQEKFDVSERTVKYDISIIRTEFKKYNLNLLNKKGIGYYISPEEKPFIIKKYSLYDDFEDQQYSDFEDIMLYLLLIEEPANKERVASVLYYSNFSIKNFIQEGAKNLPSSMSIKQITESEFSLFGSEREIRAYYVSLLFKKLKKVRKQEITKMFLNTFPLFEEKINEKKLLRIETILKQRIKNQKIWISESAYIKLFIHLYIVQLRKNYTVHYSKKELEFYKEFKSEYNFAKEVLTEIYWGMIEPHEFINLVEVMTENNVFVEDSFDLSVEERLDSVLNKMIIQVKEQHPKFELNSSDFKKDVTPHLKQILRRNQLGIEDKPNPLFYQIKQNYQIFFYTAKKLYRILCDEFDLPYSDDEVSYLTIYLYKNTFQKTEKEYSVYIVCGTGRGFSKLLKTRLTNIFENIKVIDCLSSFHLLKRNEIAKADFVVSTIDLPDIDIPVVKISSFLGQEDVNNIQQILDYGAQVSSFPVPLNNKSSLIKDDLSEVSISEESTVVFSNMFLSLFNLMVEFPPEYRINQEKILGITIHLIIALPRYYTADFINDDKDLVDEVIRIEKEHPRIAKRMTEFLEVVQNTIGKGIPYEERYALYQYIVNEGEQND